jgi:hypothetical protein
VKAIHRFAAQHQIPVVKFKKGQDKEAIARPYLEAAAREGKDRVVLIGIGQEKASVWRSKPRKGQEKRAHPHMDWWREMAFINHFYFYLWDTEWGGTFWKTNAYAPFPIWLWLNGHEWAKRQLEHAGIRYEALDNGFRSCENPAALQQICQRLGPEAVKSFDSSVESVGEFRLRELAKHMIQGKFRHTERSKAVRFSHGDFRFVVETLDNPAGNHLLGLEVIENEVPVHAQHLGDLLHRLDAGAHGLPAPFIEELAGPGRRVIVPELVKVLFEEVCADGLEVVVQQIS